MRITVVNNKSRTAKSHPFTHFRGVLIPLTENQFKGVIGTNALGRIKGNQIESLVPMIFPVTCSSTVFLPDLDKLKVLEPLTKFEFIKHRGPKYSRTSEDLSKDELNTIRVLIKVLGEEWGTIFPNMSKKYASALTGGSGTLKALLSEYKSILPPSDIVFTIRGYFELYASDYKGNILPAGRLPPEPKVETDAIHNEPGRPARPSLGQTGSTHGWGNRHGGY